MTNNTVRQTDCGPKYEYFSQNKLVAMEVLRKVKVITLTKGKNKFLLPILYACV